MLVEVVLPWTLRLIMFGMGMLLTVHDFLRLREYPRAVVAGLGGQLILLPLVGFGLAMLWQLPPELAVGLIILAACPGGTTSNLVCHLARGDVPLSITLTAVNSLIVIITIPLYAALAMKLFIGASADVSMPVLSVVWSVFNYTILPVALGMLLRARFPAFTDRIRRPYDLFAALAFIFILAVIVWNSRGNLLAMLPQVGSVTLALNLIMTVLGLGIGYLLMIGRRQTMTLGIEIGIQNTVLGMAVAASVLHGVGGLDGRIMLIPSAIYGLIMFLPAVGIILYGRAGARPPATALRVPT
jgi:BASS family bile acid:Na+ symporter